MRRKEHLAQADGSTTGVHLLLAVYPGCGLQAPLTRTLTTLPRLRAALLNMRAPAFGTGCGLDKHAGARRVASEVEVHGALHDVTQLALAAQAPRLEKVEAPVVVRRLVRGRGRGWGEGWGEALG